MKPTKEMIEAFWSKVEVQQTGAIWGLEEGLTAALAQVPGEPADDEAMIDDLRLKAFHSNDSADRQAYFDATSKWFQDRHFRHMETRPNIGLASKPAATWKKFENGNNYLKIHDKDLFANSNEINLYTSPIPHPSVDREALLEEARMVIEPFAKVAFGWEDHWPNSTLVNGVSLGSLRDALALFSKLKGSSNAKGEKDT